MSPPPAAVLARYPTKVARLRWVPLGAAGGFSGAAVWCGDFRFALKAWPATYPSARLREVHAAMARADLPFVPRVLPATGGQTVVEYGGRAWDVTTWMPGSPETGRALIDVRLSSTMSTLAVLHRAWASDPPLVDVCPGVVRRLAAIDEALTFAPGLPALALVADRAASALRPWLVRPMPLQHCLRDVHAAHVLFTEDRVTGVIDYGAVGRDSPAVDLARLLGDLVGTDPDRVRRGVELYQDAGGPSSLDSDFVLALTDAGLVGSVAFWLENPPRTPARTDRLRTLIDRLEARAAGGC